MAGFGQSEFHTKVTGRRRSSVDSVVGISSMASLYFSSDVLKKAVTSPVAFKFLNTDRSPVSYARDMRHTSAEFSHMNAFEGRICVLKRSACAILPSREVQEVPAAIDLAAPAWDT